MAGRRPESWRKQDWTPKKGIRTEGVLLATGDDDPFIVHGVKDPKTGLIEMRAEYWQRWDDLPRLKYQVYEWIIEDDAIKDLDWVDWDEIARSAGGSKEDLLRDGRSRDPVVRAWVYQAVGQYHGFLNLDGYPRILWEEDLKKRWRYY